MSARIWDTHEVGDAGEAEALTVVVDVASLRRSATGSITAGIWFEAGDECFPENGWNDFAVVILGWWLSELRALPARNNPRATARLEFMDGPVEVEIRAPEAMASPWVATWVRRGDRRRAVRELPFAAVGLLSSVEDAARALLRSCEERAWRSVELDSLRGAVRSSKRP